MLHVMHQNMLVAQCAEHVSIRNSQIRMPVSKCIASWKQCMDEGSMQHCPGAC